MNKLFAVLVLISTLISTLILSADVWASSNHDDHHAEEEAEKGPHRGRMLRQGDFAVELAIFETGVPPEFRVWVSKAGKPVVPSNVSLNVKLTRLGDVVDDIGFSAEGDYLRGDLEIYEPHSFSVTVNASYQGKNYAWHYDNLEGRTKIEQKVADAMNIKTAFAGEATLHQTVKVYGRLELPPGSQRHISARFDGLIKQSHVQLGDEVKKGQLLYTIESDESLKTYQIKAPTTALVTALEGYSGEQTQGRRLMTLTQTNVLRAELAVFPKDAQNVKLNSPVTLSTNGIEGTVEGLIADVYPKAKASQAREFWLDIDNSEGQFSPGLFITAKIETGKFQVPLAVKRAGLQSFRDFIVVYAKVGQEYEVRMLTLGRQAGPWAEVLGGLELGTEYVSENSYIIKADIEKSGAAHDH